MSSFDRDPRREEVDFNPYAAPDVPGDDRIDDSVLELDDVDESIRRANLSHEASIKSIGTLCYVGAVYIVVATVLTLVQGNIAPPQPGMDPVAYQIGVIFGVGFVFALCGVNAVLGFGLRRFQPWARWTMVALTGLSMAIFLVVAAVLAAMSTVGPVELVFLGIGAAINTYVLYLLVSPKGATVFSAAYKGVIARTPHIKYRMSILIKILLGFLLFILGMAIVAPLIKLLLKK